MTKYDMISVVKAIKKIFMNKNYTLKNLFDISYHKVLLTGANGQLGMEICEFLDLGAEVYAIDKTLSNIEKIETRKLKNLNLI